MRIFLVLVFSVLTAMTICAVQSTDPGRIAVPKVTYCELIKHPDRYHNQVVQVEGVFQRDFEQSFLSDKTICEGSTPSQTWVGYDKSFVMDGDSEEAQTNSKIATGFGKWSLTAIGRFRRAEGSERFGHLGCCRFQFTLMKIVNSEKL